METTLNSEMTKIGEWSEKDGIKTIPANYYRAQQSNLNFENKTYIVTSILVNHRFYLHSCV